MNRTKGGSIQNCIWPWMRLVCLSELLLRKVPQRIVPKASRLIEGITAEYLLADRGHDSDTVVEQAKIQGMKPVILSRKNRKTQRNCDPQRYRLRHIIENALLHLKRWRGIATRHAKTSASFLWQLFKFDALLFDLMSCDGTI